MKWNALFVRFSLTFVCNMLLRNVQLIFESLLKKLFFFVLTATVFVYQFPLNIKWNAKENFYLRICSEVKIKHKWKAYAGIRMILKNIAFCVCTLLSLTLTITTDTILKYFHCFFENDRYFKNNLKDEIFRKFSLLHLIYSTVQMTFESFRRSI